MKPGTRALIGDIIDIALRAQHDPLHRVDAAALADLSARAEEIAAAPHVEGRRLINDDTRALIAALGRIAAQGPYGDAVEIARARRLVDVLIKLAQEDLADALRQEMRPATADGGETRRARWPV